MLRKISRLSKQYSATVIALEDSSSTPKLRRHFKLQGAQDNGSFCDSTVNVSVEEMDCSEIVDTQDADVAKNKESRLENTTQYKDST